MILSNQPKEKNILKKVRGNNLVKSGYEEGPFWGLIVSS